MPQSKQTELTKRLTNVIEGTLKASGVPPLKLRYVTDAGSIPHGYFRKVLTKMKHPVTGKALKWSWGVDFFHACVCRRENNRGFPFGPGGPGSPFGQPDEKQPAATEFTDYAIQTEDTERILLKKSYQFNKPKVVDDPSMNIISEGTWTFNLRDHLPDAIDFKQKLTIVDGNTQTAFPISIKYQRLSADAIAKLELEAKQKKDDITKKMAEVQR